MGKYNQLDVLLEEESIEQSDTRELKCLAMLQSFRPIDPEIERPSDHKLQNVVERTIDQESNFLVSRPSVRKVSFFSDWTVTDFLLLIVALLLFLNFVTK